MDQCIVKWLLVGITRILLIVVLLTPLIIPRDSQSPQSQNMISVWSQITIQRVDAYSTIYERPPDDCMRPKWVKCFSIQQNFWIIDSGGAPVVWAQNVENLAKINATYYGTFSFEVWDVNKIRPELCDPQSDNITQCRAPFYDHPIQFPRSLTFYAHISALGPGNTLHMSNDFGSVDWTLPSVINCPCYIEAVKSGPLPWGYSPFEFVAVGLDSLALAIFSNQTIGTFGPIMAQSLDGVWRAATLSTLTCSYVGDCPNRPGTGESSMNLHWNTTTGVFRYAVGAYDQGVYINGLSDSEMAPLLPVFPHVEYLYLRLFAAIGSLSLYDEQSRELGFDSVSGQWVQQIPNSTIIFSHNVEEIVLMNPNETYTLVIAAGGNTVFNLLVSKSSNTENAVTSVNAEGTLKMGESRTYLLDSANMQLTSHDTGLMNTFRAPDFDLLLLLTVWGVTILSILIVLRHRKRSRVED